MKIKDAQPTPPLRKPASPQAGTGHAGAATRTEPSQTRTTVEAAQRLAEGRRAQEFRALEAQVRNGTYRPDPGRIAERILASAELDAQLRVALAFP